MSEDVYIRLRTFLQRMPTAFPATRSGVELKILRKLFTEEQSELTMKLTPVPEDAGSIAARTGLSETDLSEKLEEMTVGTGRVSTGRRNRERAMPAGVEFLSGEPCAMLFSANFLKGVCHAVT